MTTLLVLWIIFGGLILISTPIVYGVWKHLGYGKNDCYDGMDLFLFMSIGGIFLPLTLIIALSIGLGYLVYYDPTTK